MSRDIVNERVAPDIETSSAAYAQRFAGAVGRWFLDVQAQATMELMGPWRGGTVLDVGGGHGQLTGPLVNAGFEVTVLGSAPSCRERVCGWVEAGQARFVVGDLMRAPWADRSFDVVLALRLLPHMQRWGDFVAELARLASKAVVVDYPTVRSLNVLSAPLFGLKQCVETHARPFTVFSDGDVANAFRGQGFVPTGRRAQFFWPMALHRAVRAQALSRVSEGVARVLGLTHAWGSPVLVCAERGDRARS